MRRVLGLLTAAVLLLAGGCGGGGKPTIKVSAAASLKQAFESYAKDFDAADVSFSFAGSDELAAQIRQGVKPDVYAAANTKLPRDLYADGLVERPIRFASNQLVIAVPKGGKVRSIGDLAKPGTGIAAGAATVPIGSYTREVLLRLPHAEALAISAASLLDRLGVADVSRVGVTRALPATGRLGRGQPRQRGRETAGRGAVEQPQRA